MKGLSIEEKAKRYDEAIERAKSKIKNDKDHVLYEDDVIEIFPEIKESEGERIRKELIAMVKLSCTNGDDVDEKIAWLEKQGEQKEQLINKACGLLANCIEDFMLRRMEIWDEACKKQTLENICKKLEK